MAQQSLAVQHGKHVLAVVSMCPTGVPGWTAAAASLLHAISKSGTGELEGAVREKVGDGLSHVGD
jgi:hypothetical protein